MRLARCAVLSALSVLCAQCVIAAPAKPVAKPQQLKWPRPVISKARSSNGKIVAVYDRTGFYLADAVGQHRRKLSISLGDRGGSVTSITLSFNRAGTLLAVMARDWSGEPHVNYEGLLWSVETKTAAVRKVKEWGDSLLGAGWREVDHELSGWSSDGKSVKITADVYYLTDGIADMQERGPRSFWVSVTKPQPKYALLTTSVGKRLLASGTVRAGVNGKRVFFHGEFTATGLILSYGIWLVGPNKQMKLGETVYTDEGEHAEFCWSGKADLSNFTDFAIYRLPRDNTSPGKGAIRILSLPLKSISAANSARSHKK